MNKDKQNAIWLSANFIFTSLSSLIIIKLNLENFGNQKFGIWLLLSSIWGFGTSLDLGLGTSIIKYVAEYRKNYVDRIPIFLASSIVVFVIMGIIIIILGNIFAYLFYFSNLKIIPNQLNKEFSIVLLILSANFFVRYLGIFYNNILEGLSQFKVSSRILMLQSLLNLIMVIIIFAKRWSVIHLSIGQLLVSFITLYLFWFFLRLKYVEFRINIQNFNLTELKKILKFSVNVQLMSVFNSIIDPIIKLIIASFYLVNIIPAYEIARRITIAISGLFFNAFKIVLPKSSELINREHQKSFLENTINRYCKYGVIYSGIFYGILLPAIIFLLDVLFNLNEAILILLILSLPETVNNFGYSIYNFILGIGKVSVLMAVQFINLLITSLSVILFFVLFNNVIGMIGYFFSVVIGNIIMIVYLKRRFEFDVNLFLKNASAIKLFFVLFYLGTTVFIIVKTGEINYIYLIAISLVLLMVFIKDIKYNLNGFYLDFLKR
ncbi:oligosaccharide flippase family protein [Ignavibacterium album]|uniref:oligosaccharide flippase family protein n=1 Tax=Ignavibacterium album TaxID=591197 RepID=UPI0035B850B5